MSQTYTGIAIKSPGDVTPITEDWSTFLAKTSDTIQDCDAFGDPGLKVEDCWFTLTDTTAKVSGGVDGADYGLKFVIYTTAGYTYERTIRVRCRNQ